MAAIVGLLSDFGHADHYVGAMKGAVLAACPEATLVDLVHDVPAHDVRAGALALEAAYRAFPGRSVFVAVVDPGVGSSRRGLAVSAGGYFFVGPDNGLLSLVAGAHQGARTRALTNAGLFRYEVSALFHGRDVFAPVAGHLARGGAFEEVGPLVEDMVVLRLPALERRGPGEWAGEVLHVDHFGNLVTNVSAADLEAVAREAAAGLDELLVSIAGAIVPVARVYADVAVGEPCALVGSGGRLEVAVNQGSAAREMGAGRGSPVRLFLPRPSGPEAADEVVI
jgi:S-adenosylmethionine hydrolase